MLPSSAMTAGRIGIGKPRPTSITGAGRTGKASTSPRRSKLSTDDGRLLHHHICGGRIGHRGRCRVDYAPTLIWYWPPPPHTSKSPLHWRRCWQRKAPPNSEEPFQGRGERVTRTLPIAVPTALA